jgi:hypothetical protein
MFTWKNDSEIQGEELHHSCTDQSTIEFAQRVMGELRQKERGEEVWNKWCSAKINDKEVFERGGEVINDLLIILRRLTKNSTCSKCGGRGSYTERMGGCRDDNESVICSKCQGRFKVL